MCSPMRLTRPAQKDKKKTTLVFTAANRMSRARPNTYAGKRLLHHVPGERASRSGLAPCSSAKAALSFAYRPASASPVVRAHNRNISTVSVYKEEHDMGRVRYLAVRRTLPQGCPTPESCSWSPSYLSRVVARKSSAFDVSRCTTRVRGLTQLFYFPRFPKKKN
jgi:hypothetical protein